MWKKGEQEKSVYVQCSFCGKAQDRSQLTAGPDNIYICNGCVARYWEYFENARPVTSERRITQVCSICGTCAPVSHRYCYNCGSQCAQEK